MSAVERAVLIADLTGFTALAEAHGDVDAADVATRFADLARAALKGDARLVKAMGDAVLIVASAAADALDTALALALAVEAEPDYLAVSAGLCVGPVVERAGDVYGTVVNRTARLAAHAGPGRLLATTGFAAVLPADRRAGLRPAGEARFKNVVDPVALLEVDRDAERRGEVVVDPVCRMRLDPAQSPLRVDWSGREWYLCSPGCEAAFRARPEAYVAAAAERPSA